MLRISARVGQSAFRGGIVNHWCPLRSVDFCWAVGVGCQCCMCMLKSGQCEWRLKVAKAPWETPCCTLSYENRASCGCHRAICYRRRYRCHRLQRGTLLFEQTHFGASGDLRCGPDSSDIGGVEVDWHPRVVDGAAVLLLSQTPMLRGARGWIDTCMDATAYEWLQEWDAPEASSNG